MNISQDKPVDNREGRSQLPPTITSPEVCSLDGVGSRLPLLVQGNLGRRSRHAGHAGALVSHPTRRRTNENESFFFFLFLLLFCSGCQWRRHQQWGGGGVCLQLAVWPLANESPPPRLAGSLLCFLAGGSRHHRWIAAASAAATVRTVAPVIPPPLFALLLWRKDGRQGVKKAFYSFDSPWVRPYFVLADTSSKKHGRDGSN